MLFRNKKNLIVSKDLAPVLSQKEADVLCSLQNELVQDYIANRDKMSLEEWLESALNNRLTNADPNQVKQESQLTLETLSLKEEKLQDLLRYNANGFDDATWFAKEMKSQTKGMSIEDSQQHINSIAQAIEQANKKLFNLVNMRASLAEQGISYEGVHDGAQNLVARFNYEAAKKSSEYHAELDTATISDDLPYGQVNILDGQGKVVDSYGVRYEDIADNEEAWRIHNVYTKDQVLSETLNKSIDIISDKTGIESDKVRQIVDIISEPDQIANNLKDLALDKSLDFLSDKTGIDRDSISQTVDSFSDPDFANKATEALKNVVKKKAIEFASEKTGIDLTTVNKVVDIITDPDPGEKVIQTLKETAIESSFNIIAASLGSKTGLPTGPTVPLPLPFPFPKPSPSGLPFNLDYILGPDGVSSGKYMNIPWGGNYGGDVFKAPFEGWNEATLKDRSMNVGCDVWSNATMNIGCGDVVDMAINAWKKINRNEDVGTAVEKLVTNGDLQGLKTATAAAIRVGVDKGLLPSIVPNHKLPNMPTISLIADLAVSKTHDIAHSVSDVLIDKTVGKHVMATAATIGQMGGQKLGATIGSVIGSVLGPIGTTVGTVVGAGLGFLCGAKVGQAVCNGLKKVAHKVVDAVGSAVKSVAKGVVSGIKAVGSGICRTIGSVASGIKSVASAAWNGVKSVGSAIASFFGF